MFNYSSCSGVGVVSHGRPFYRIDVECAGDSVRRVIIINIDADNSVSTSA